MHAHRKADRRFGANVIEAGDLPSTGAVEPSSMKGFTYLYRKVSGVDKTAPVGTAV
jgi:hypothetical protein